jgi:hypothetical protein
LAIFIYLKLNDVGAKDLLWLISRQLYSCLQPIDLLTCRMLGQCFNHKIRQGGLLTRVPALAQSKFEVGPVIIYFPHINLWSHLHPDRPLGLQVVQAPRISRQSEHKGGKLSVRRIGRLYPAGDSSDTYFCQKLSSVFSNCEPFGFLILLHRRKLEFSFWIKELGISQLRQWKIPITVLETEPATSRPVA